MLIRDFVEVSLPLESAVKELADPRRWTAAMAARRDAGERELLARFGLECDPAGLDGADVVHVGRPRRQQRGTVVDVGWTTRSAAAWFPSMQAEVVLSNLGPNRTHVEFSGSYALRAGLPTRVADRLVLYRVGEHAVRLVLTHLVEELKGVSA